MKELHGDHFSHDGRQIKLTFDLNTLG